MQNTAISPSLVRHTLRTLPALVAALFVGNAGASGFQLLEQNASGIGNAFAGSAAVAEDASTVFFNPAGMAYLTPGKTHLAVGLDLIKPQAKFSDRGSVAAAGQVLGNGNGGDAGDLAYVPHAYIVVPITQQISFGLGMGAPFGLKTEYDPDWNGRFHAIKSDVKTINLNPSLSFKLNDQIAIGIGANWQRLEGEFSSAVNYAALIGYLATQPGLGGLAALAPGAGYGFSNISGDDSAWGYNLGILWQATPATRLGLSYRSEMKYHVTGTAGFTPNANLTTALGQIALATNQATADAIAAGLPTRGGAVYMDIKLPDTWILSAQHRLDDRWELLGDLSWTGWSKIQSLDFYYANDNSLLSGTPERWRDTLRVALGANYKLDGQWTLRGGLAFDEAPVPDSTRTPRLPDSDRTWLSFGAKYRLDADSSLDIGYSHLFVKKSNINDDAGNPANSGIVIGSYKNSVDILGVQYSKQF
jgi:long-chain fatty acid transport protein